MNQNETLFLEQFTLQTLIHRDNALKEASNGRLSDQCWDEETIMRVQRPNRRERARDNRGREGGRQEDKKANIDSHCPGDSGKRI